MDLVPEVHLDDDWVEAEHDNCISYTKENLRILIHKHNNDKLLQIKSRDGGFFTVKKIETYWELQCMDTFINSDTTSDGDHLKFQEDFMIYVRDSFANFEYLVINKNTGHVFGVNDLFYSEGWSDETLETMWDRSEIEVIDMLQDVNPLILTERGWEEIEVKIPKNKEQNREDNINILTD